MKTTLKIVVEFSAGRTWEMQAVDRRIILT
jgi:hypothetical protein